MRAAPNSGDAWDCISTLLRLAMVEQFGLHKQPTCRCSLLQLHGNQWRGVCGCWVRRWQDSAVQREDANTGQDLHPWAGAAHHECGCDVRWWVMHWAYLPHAICGRAVASTSASTSAHPGKWVLATTRSYLMVLKTTYKDPSTGRELCGFSSRMGSSAPAPRLLRLRPEDVTLTGGAPMEKGHFTWVTQAGRQERWIVASCGNYTVLWNFRRAACIPLLGCQHGCDKSPLCFPVCPLYAPWSHCATGLSRWRHPATQW